MWISVFPKNNDLTLDTHDVKKWIVEFIDYESSRTETHYKQGTMETIFAWAQLSKTQWHDVIRMQEYEHPPEPTFIGLSKEDVDKEIDKREENKRRASMEQEQERINELAAELSKAEKRYEALANKSVNASK